jgi:antitoxin (DNA-binding transcriptional repressor) of toxin-antitoxin stability system
MSTNIEIDEAQENLKEIISKLGPNDEVVIIDNNQPVARLFSGQSAGRKPRKPGNCKGMITIVSDDAEHLEDFKEYMP